MLAIRLTRRRNYALIGASPAGVLALSGVDIDGSGVTALYLAALGALVGVVVAALRPQAPRAPRRAAWVAPRRSLDYAPRFAVRGSWAAAAVITVEVVAVRAIEWPEPKWLNLVLNLTILLVAIAGLHGVLRAVAHRSLPATTAAEVAVEDGLRREASHTVAAGVLAFLILGVFTGLAGTFEAAVERRDGDQAWNGFESLLLLLGRNTLAVVGVVLAALAWTRTTRAGLDLLRRRVEQR